MPFNPNEPESPTSPTPEGARLTVADIRQQPQASIKTLDQTRHLKPTMKLRWFVPKIGEYGDGAPVLQQWWTDDHQNFGMWVEVATDYD